MVASLKCALDPTRPAEPIEVLIENGFRLMVVTLQGASAGPRGLSNAHSDVEALIALLAEASS